MTGLLRGGATPRPLPSEKSKSEMVVPRQLQSGNERRSTSDDLSDVRKPKEQAGLGVLTRDEIKQAVREVLREERLVRAISLKAVMLTVILSMIIGAGLLLSGWKLYEKFIIDVEEAELHASARTAEIVNDLRGLKSACLLYYAEHVGVSSSDVSSVAIESLMPYLVTPLTNERARIIVQEQSWLIEYPVDNDARVRTALRDRASELGLTRTIQGAVYNGGDTIYMLGRR